MTLHTCRDFRSTGNPLNLYCPFLSLYYAAIFMRVTLGYSVVGQTNFNIDGGTLRLGNGNNGSLNQGGSDVYAFKPNGYTVSVNDIGRILCLKSPGYPMLNSGLFRVTGIDTSNNWLYINYRSGDTPPAETGMTWGLYEIESVFSGLVNQSGNGITGTYQTQGSATASRLILQSPSSLNWQIRLCAEASYDWWGNGGSVSPHGSSGGTTFAPGYGGNVAGDFQPGGQHLHVPLFFNKHVTDYAGMSVSLFANGNQIRFYVWGDDSTGTCFMVGRNVVGGNDGFVHFGLPEDEEQPLPPHNAQRLFAIGNNAVNNGGNSSIGWNTGTSQQVGRGGVAFGLSNQPISCIYSLYTPLDGQSFLPGSTSPRASLNAGDNAYIAASELQPVDLLAGTVDNMLSTSGYEVFNLEGRRLGRAPLVRMGRSNYGYFQISTDISHSWLHLTDGIYLPWQGSILP